MKLVDRDNQISELKVLVDLLEKNKETQEYQIKTLASRVSKLEEENNSLHDVVADMAVYAVTQRYPSTPTKPQPTEGAVQTSMVRKIKKKERKRKRDEDFEYSRKKQGEKRKLKQVEMQDQIDKIKGKEKIQDSCIDVDIIMPSEKPENKGDEARRWKACKKLGSDLYDKLAQMHQAEGKK